MITLLEDNAGLYMATYRSHGVYDPTMGLATFAAKAEIDPSIANRHHPLLGRLLGSAPMLEMPLTQCSTKSSFVESPIDALYFLVQQHKTWKRRLTKTLTAEMDRLIVERMRKHAKVCHESGPRAVQEGDAFALAPIDTDVLKRVFFVTGVNDSDVVLTPVRRGLDGWVRETPRMATGDTTGLVASTNPSMKLTYLGYHGDALRRVRPAPT